MASKRSSSHSSSLSSRPSSPPATRNASTTAFPTRQAAAPLSVAACAAAWQPLGADLTDLGALVRPLALALRPHGGDRDAQAEEWPAEAAAEALCGALEVAAFPPSASATELSRSLLTTLSDLASLALPHAATAAAASGAAASAADASGAVAAALPLARTLAAAVAASPEDAVALSAAGGHAVGGAGEGGGSECYGPLRALLLLSSAEAGRASRHLLAVASCRSRAAFCLCQAELDTQ